MAATNFFRALGGAVGAAVLGAIFAARAGAAGANGAVTALPAGTRAHIVDAVQTVFVVVAPLALAGLLLVLFLPERPLSGPHQPPAGRQPQAR